MMDVFFPAIAGHLSHGLKGWAGGPVDITFYHPDLLVKKAPALQIAWHRTRHNLSNNGYKLGQLYFDIAVVTALKAKPKAEPLKQDLLESQAPHSALRARVIELLDGWEAKLDQYRTVSQPVVVDEQSQDKPGYLITNLMYVVPLQDTQRTPPSWLQAINTQHDDTFVFPATTS